MNLNDRKPEKNSILVVDDDNSIRRMLRMILTNKNFLVVEAKNGQEAIDILKKRVIDLIISDVMMPKVDGFQLCRYIKNDPNLMDSYLLLLTAKNAINDRVTGLDIGADDYLGKPFAITELLARVKAAFRMIDMQKELKLKNKMLRDASIRDSLTQVYNRHYFNESISKEVARSKRYENNLSLIIVDIDHFKLINDTYGHLVGDEALKEVASALQKNTRKDDTVARYGGEEFVIILPETVLEKAHEAAERLRRVVQELKFQHNEKLIAITISAGTSSFQENKCQTENDFIDKADQSLLTAKRSGRNRSVICQENLYIPGENGL
ncbi:MAG: hypothetical protein B6244_10510 [Candidatus Cloacimonetes bacterium 4572_55]|nr:MAG: hypothetical protein B6244_10510 [Candidatus Cloacimonetes bacterium 4572_55]